MANTNATKRCGDCHGRGRHWEDEMCRTCDGEGEVCAACGVAPYYWDKRVEAYVCDCDPPETDEDYAAFVRAHSAGAQ